MRSKDRIRSRGSRSRWAKPSLRKPLPSKAAPKSKRSPPSRVTPKAKRRLPGMPLRSSRTAPVRSFSKMIAVISSPSRKRQNVSMAKILPTLVAVPSPTPIAPPIPIASPTPIPTPTPPRLRMPMMRSGWLLFFPGRHPMSTNTRAASWSSSAALPPIPALPASRPPPPSAWGRVTPKSSARRSRFPRCARSVRRSLFAHGKRWPPRPSLPPDREGPSPMRWAAGSMRPTTLLRRNASSTVRSSMPTPLFWWTGAAWRRSPPTRGAA